MIIVAGGDSFVFGSELKSQENTFTALLSQDHKYTCVAKPGYANESISRTVIAESIKHNKLGIIVSWTFPGRYEFRFNYDTKTADSPWQTINAWTIEDKKILESYFNDKNKDIYTGFMVRRSLAEKTGYIEFARVYYEHVGNNEYWETYTTLKEIVYLQNYCKLHNIPYLFTCASTEIFYNHTVQKSDPFITSLYNQIDFDSWFLFDGDKGFFQWAIANKYPIGAMHPLDESHYDAYTLMKDKFNELVTKPLEQSIT